MYTAFGQQISMKANDKMRSTLPRISSSESTNAACIQTTEMSDKCEHKASDLESLFFELFYPGMQTRLLGGAKEPLYLPASADATDHDFRGDNLLYYREDFYASALHEISHWCIAGEQRLKQVDFGYWYLPDGRTAEQQEAFENVEVQPQALEWLFSLACNYDFSVSKDNLNGDICSDSEEDSFAEKVRIAALGYLSHGLPNRATVFYKALSCFYNTDIAVGVIRAKLMSK